MTDDSPKTLTFDLEEPVTLGAGEKAKTFASITLRKMKGKDLLVMDKVKGEMTKTTAMLASMAGVPFQVFEEMSADDFQNIMAGVVPLMGKRGRAALEDALKQGDSPELSD